MDHAQEVRILKELMHQLDEGHSADAGALRRQDMSVYTDPDLAQREWTVFFRKHPQLIGLSGDLPGPNSFITVNDFGVPVLATRDQSGRFRAFVNACRHRGVQLVAEQRGIKQHFCCPFHGWQYNNDGALAAIPQEAMFGAVDKACHGLVELPAVEKYGLLWVHPQADGKLDPDALLAGFSKDIDAGAYGDYVFRGETTLDMALNWKLANDTFGENYHFSVLHRNTLARVLYGNHGVCESSGRNFRSIFCRKTIDHMRTLPESEWDLISNSLIVYFLFPNIQLIPGEGRVSLIKIYPDHHNPGRSISQVRTYFARSMLDGIEAAACCHSANLITPENVYQPRQPGDILSPEAIMEIFNSTIERQDYAMGESQQRIAESGQLPFAIFGRNEPALQHFHECFRSALDMPPLEVLKE